MFILMNSLSSILTPILTSLLDYLLIYLVRQQQREEEAVGIIKDTSAGRGRRMWWRWKRKRMRQTWSTSTQRSTAINKHVFRRAIRPKDLQDNAVNVSDWNLLKNTNPLCFPKLFSTAGKSNNNHHFRERRKENVCWQIPAEDKMLIHTVNILKTLIHMRCRLWASDARHKTSGKWAAEQRGGGRRRKQEVNTRGTFNFIFSECSDEFSRHSGAFLFSDFSEKKSLRSSRLFALHHNHNNNFMWISLFSFRVFIHIKCLSHINTCMWPKYNVII